MLTFVSMITYIQSLKGIIWGIIASFFLSSTFLINSLIAESGGHWAWTANLRTFFLIPILAIVLLVNKKLHPLVQAIISKPKIFIKWGIIGFGILYSFVALASLFAPGWMIAASFQMNIVFGILLAPFIYKDHRRKIPKQAVLLSLLILIGVLVMQFEKADGLGNSSEIAISFVLVLIGAIVWPLGNRKLMVVLEENNLQLNAVQRVLGMSIGSIPLLIVLAIIGYAQSGLPTISQCQASLYSAFFSGFLGGVAFYHATQMVHKNPIAIAAIEATQALEIIFTLLGEMILLGTSFPGTYGQIGMLIVLTGLILHFVNVLLHSKKLSQMSVSSN